MKKVWAVILIAALVLSAAPAVSAANEFSITAIDGKTVIPELTQGSAFSSGIITVKNDTAATVDLDSYEIVTDFDVTKYPFEVENLSSLVSLSGSVNSGDTFNIDLTSLKVRSDAPVGYYTVAIKINYNSGSTSQIDLNVKINQAAQQPTNALVPKVIVSGYSTNPSTIVAGNTFTLTVTFTNKGATPVSAVKASITSDGTFAPVSGTSTMYIDNLAAGESKSASLKMQAKADAAPGSYSVNIALNYDAPGANNNEPVTDSETLTLPVIQTPKISVDALTITPETVYVGSEVNISTKVNNTGKSTLYNVTAQFTDKNGIFADTSVYVGNITSGSSGTVDTYLTAQDAGDADVTVTITYENESGKKYTYTDTYATTVTEREVTPVGPDEPVQPVKTGLPWWVYVFFVLIAGAAAFFIVRKKKKAQAARDAEKEEALSLEEQMINEDDGKL